MRIAILDDYLGVAMQLADWGAVQSAAQVDVFRQPIPSAQAAERLAAYDVVCLMRERMAMPGELIAKLPNLKLICMTGLYNRTLDLDAAKACGVVVCSTGFPPHGALATPELAWGLMLSVLRDIPALDAGVHAGEWQTRLGRSAAGKTLGLLGLGRTGAAMARYARAFQMTPSAWRRTSYSPAATLSASTSFWASAAVGLLTGRLWHA
jgi:phosphoglycerate dehydrogenase-like enzyme